MHALSKMIASKCLARGWIQEEQLPWCEYAVKNKILSFLFFVLLVLVTALLHVYLQAFIFVGTLIILRKRFGGWHAPNARLCQICSIGIVILVTKFLGPWMETLSIKLIWGINIALMIIAVITKPVYPPCLHFDDIVVYENNRIKNRILLVLLLLQGTLCWKCNAVLVYGFLSVLTGVMSVYIEIIHQKGVETHEETRAAECEDYYGLDG